MVGRKGTLPSYTSPLSNVPNSSLPNKSLKSHLHVLFSCFLLLHSLLKMCRCNMHNSYLTAQWQSSMLPSKPNLKTAQSLSLLDLSSACCTTPSFSLPLVLNWHILSFLVSPSPAPLLFQGERGCGFLAYTIQVGAPETCYMLNLWIDTYLLIPSCLNCYSNISFSKKAMLTLLNSLPLHNILSTLYLLELLSPGYKFHNNRVFIATFFFFLTQSLEHDVFLNV